MTILNYLFIRNRKATCKKRLLFILLLFVTSPFLLLGPASAAIFSSKDLNALHARFDFLEKKLENLESTLNNLDKMIQAGKSREETTLRNQADIKSEINALHVELSNVYGLAQSNNQNLSESIQKLTVLIEEKFQNFQEFQQIGIDQIQKFNQANLDRTNKFNQAFFDQIQKFKEFNEAYLEQEGKNKEILFNNFQFELEKVASKIADLASIYKTLNEEEFQRDNNNTAYFDNKMKEINVLISQLIEISIESAVEETRQANNLVYTFDKQFASVNTEISELVNIYKQSISAIADSSKGNLDGIIAQLDSINSKIRQLATIYKATIKENNATFKAISKNLSKELHSIRHTLSKNSGKVKPSPAKKKK